MYNYNLKSYLNLNSEIIKKTYKYLSLEDIYSYDNLLAAAEITATGFRSRRDTISLLSSKYGNIKKLMDEVLSEKFEPRYYKQKIINERGKPRIILPPTYETKIVGKLLSEFILRPMLEPMMIKTSYATIRGRGTDKLYIDLTEELNNAINNYKYIVKADCKNYFGSIKKEYLKKILFEDNIKDSRILNLLMKFYKDDIGITLGNEVSQLPASAFLTPVDKYITGKYDCKYFRYMDDILVIAKNKKDAKEIKRELIEQTATMDILIPIEKISIIGLKGDFIFCKERFFYDKKKHHYYNLPNPKKFSTQRRKIDYLSENNPEKLKQQFKSVITSLEKHGNCKKEVVKLQKTYEKQLQSAP